MIGVQDWLLWRSTVSPHQPALKFGSVQWNYEELQERVSNLSGLLQSWGLKKRDRVGLLLNPSEIYIAAVHALARIGVVTVPLNVRQSPSELLFQLKNCNPSLVLYDPALSDLKKRIEEEKTDRTFRWKRYTELRTDANSKPIRGGLMNTASVHSIIYTSGSTGTSKGVKITFSNLLWNAIGFGIRHNASSSDRWLLVMPLFHVGGYTIIFRSVLHGSNIILHPRFEAAKVVESLDRDRITLVSFVPTMFERILKLHRGSFSRSLRLVFLGGSKIPTSLLQEILQRRLHVVFTYGMTETCSQVAISSVGSSAGLDKISYRPMFPTTMAIKSRKALTSQSGKVGEILVRGPTVFRGYWGEPRMTSAAFKKGWFCTGDLGFLDGQGGIVVLGRKDDIMISGGEKINPGDVESSLLQHGAIEDAVVIGREDRGWGQRVEAVVKVKQNSQPPSATELTKFLQGRIGRYKIPKAYHFWASIPKTPTGKTRRGVVRELVERGEEWQERKDRIEAE